MHAATGRVFKSLEWQYTMSVHPYGCPGGFCDFFSFINFQFGGPACRDEFIPSRVQFILYVCLSLCMVVRVDFLQSKRTDRNYVQRMRLQAMGSNPLSGSIICTSVRPSVYLWAFCDIISVCLVVSGNVWTQINVSRRWIPILEIITNTFPVWGSIIAMYLSLNRG